MYICTMEYYSPMRKDIRPFVTTWVDLKGIMLSKVRQSEKDKHYYDIAYPWNLKKQNSSKQSRMAVTTD